LHSFLQLLHNTIASQVPVAAPETFLTCYSGTNKSIQEICESTAS